jgi:hypothetical protein
LAEGEEHDDFQERWASLRVNPGAEEQTEVYGGEGHPLTAKSSLAPAQQVEEVGEHGADGGGADARAACGRGDQRGAGEKR